MTASQAALASLSPTNSAPTLATGGGRHAPSAARKPVVEASIVAPPGGGRSRPGTLLMSQSAAQLTTRAPLSLAASSGHYAPAASAGAAPSRWPSSALAGAPATPTASHTRSMSPFGTAAGMGRTRAPQQRQPRESREWVAKQAAIDAEFALNQRLHAATYKAGPRVPYRDGGTAASSAVGNFITGRPVPQPARKTFTETHGVPWLRHDAA